MKDRHPTDPTPLPMPKAQAINIHDAPGYQNAVYIGRAMRDRTGEYRALLGIRSLEYIPASPWANQFTIDRDTWENRIQAIRLFRSRLWEKSIRSRLHELRGKALVCWCHPKPCHGDILADLANKILFYGAPCPACGRPVGSELRPAPKDQGDVVESWRCPSCHAWGSAERGTILIHPPTDPNETPPLL